MIRDYPSVGYDAVAPLTTVISVAIPTQVGNFQYGDYIFDVQLTDADATVYTLTKTLNLCAPNSKDKTKNYGELSAKLDAACSTDLLYVELETPPLYKGVASDSQVNDLTLQFPTGSGRGTMSSVQRSFSTTLYEGVHNITGTVCANYPIGDNVFIKVNYHVKKEKNVRCMIDQSCLAAKLALLDKEANYDCTDAEKAATQEKTITILRLIKTVEVFIEAGLDASPYIDQLEDLIGCLFDCE